MKNQEIARIFREISLYLEMQGIEFKPRAYEKAAHSVDALEKDVSVIYEEGGLKALMEVPGVGKSIAEKIEEFVKTGKIKYHEDLRKKVPVDVSGLSRVEGLGPKSIAKLYKKLGIRTMADLELAAKSGKIRGLPHFGEKAEQNILKNIGFLKNEGSRLLLMDAIPLAREIVKRLQGLPFVEKAAVAGSTRRWKETVGDLDVQVVSSRPEKVMQFFTSMPEVTDVIAKGTTKSSVRLDAGVNADVRVVPAESFGAALQYFTGNKEHNIALRKIAISKGLKLNEYGLFRGKKQVAGPDERGVYEALGLEWVPPELRENAGEVEAALKHRLPKLIDYGDLRGDLQVTTNWTDGGNSIAEMAEEAARLGLEYIAIADHTKALAMTGGLDEKGLARQAEEIRRVNKKLKSLRILRGVEANILKDGSLDISDKTLAEIDVVGAGVHTNFKQPREQMTRRLIRAMENPHVDILVHPTGRIINKRPPYEADIDALIKAARRTKTVLEIDAYPDRLDLKDEHARKAIEAGVRLAIDSDAHSKLHFHYLEFGVATARRAWAERRDVINAWPAEKMLSMLKK